QGTVLAVTSNPTRTSPVKRGLFLLDNILGTPPAPPPPDIPPLEDAARDIKDRTPTLRETLALHREKPLCSSCHNRMDPLGLALEYYDVATVDRIVERLEKTNGRPSELLAGIVESAPFQKTRSAHVAAGVSPAVEPGILPGGTGARASRTP